MNDNNNNKDHSAPLALVTGAGGFLGQHLCRLLQENGLRVRGLARGHYPELEKSGVEMVRADISQADSLAPALEGVDVVFHTASKVAMWGDWKDFYRINYTGTLNIVAAARQQGVKNFVYTSTPSVVFEWDSIKNGDEALPYAKKSKSRYARSKALAEAYVLSQKSDQFRVCALRPHLIFGPGDQNMIPRLIEAAKAGRLKQVGDGDNSVDVVYVENAALAHLQAYHALEKGLANGEAYFIGQGPVKLWPFINQILEYNHVAPIKKKVPFPIAYGLGAMIEAALQLVGKYDVHPPMSRFVALQLAKDHYFGHQKAQKDLGFSPTISVEEALKRTFEHSTPAQ